MANDRIGRPIAGVLLLVLVAAMLAACPAPDQQYILQAGETPVLLEDPVVADESGAGAVVVPAEEVGLEDLGGETAAPVSPLALSGTLVRAVSLFDRTLQLADGRSVGNIRDFVVDATTGQLLYSVVAYDELLGLGGTQVALPLATLGWNPDLQLVLTVDEETVRAAPTVTNEWPAEFGDAWHVEQANFWGQTGLLPEVGAEVAPVRLRPMIGLHAGGLGEDLGILEDMLLDLSQERVVYLAIFQTAGLQDPDRMLLVPYGVAELQVAVVSEAPSQAIVLLAVEPEVLQAAPWLDRSIFLTVDFMDESFVEELNSYWQEQGQPVPAETE
jgi:sporulation protein YlmC with PRC-barrel domain